jgi:hypothetical protein
MKVALKGPTLAVLSSAWIAHENPAVVGEHAFVEAILACETLLRIEKPHRAMLRDRFAIVRRTP